nr:hypothetical protein Itr_chr08CG21400 [Ipomoea trifida]GMD28780.1 hypothetical protein Iba_chr08eCG10550 [Ipomoea batatas]
MGILSSLQLTVSQQSYMSQQFAYVAGLCLTWRDRLGEQCGWWPVVKWRRD